MYAKVSVTALERGVEQHRVEQHTLRSDGARDADGFTRIEAVPQFALSRDALSAMVAGEHARAEALLHERLRVPGDAGDETATAAGLNGLGERVLWRGDARHAARLHREALRLYRRLGNGAGVAWSLQFLGETARQRVRCWSARVLHLRALAAFRALADEAGVSRALAGLGSVARRLGEPASAHTLYRESLLLAAVVGETSLIATAVAGIAGTALDTGRPRTAALLLQAVRRLLPARQLLPWPGRREYARDVRRARRWMSGARVSSRWRHATTASVVAWLVGSPVPHPVPYQREDGAPVTDAAPTRVLPPAEANADDQRYHLALLRAQSETSLDGIIVISAEAGIAHMNQRFVRMWGIPAEVAEGRVREGVTARVMELVADPAAYLARSDYLYHHPDEAFSAEVALKDGRVLEQYSAPIVGEEGTCYGRIGYYRDVTERKRAEARVRTQGEALRRQVGALRAARTQATRREEGLRQEIAEFLHSQVQTRLVVAQHRADRALEQLEHNPEEAAALLRQLRDELDDIRESGVRRASHLLHPTVISLGLLPALALLQERFRGALEIGMAVDHRLSGAMGEEGVHVPEGVALAAYRVVEEALANVSRHAGVPTARVTLSLTPDLWLQATVSDAGKGFDPDAAYAGRDGLGFRAIAWRVEEFGGSWVVHSAPGEGTTVTARFPLGLPPTPSPSPSSVPERNEAIRKTHRAH